MTRPPSSAIHARYVLVIIDEAGGVPKSIFARTAAQSPPLTSVIEIAESSFCNPRAAVGTHLRNWSQPAGAGPHVAGALSRINSMSNSRHGDVMTESARHT